MRLLGARLVRPTRAPQTRSRYVALGALLAVELLGGGAVTASRQIARSIRGIRGISTNQEGGEVDIDVHVDEDQVCDETLEDPAEGRVSSAQQEPAASDRDDERNTSSKGRCVLCIGPLVNTAATECGHLFCW
eukprot:CAMPEP_0171979886 /NCGR_PEP_ID=MMETSP0993-20121228/258909_1 /TAXON_ID=483369 /ORGANISM="non described non described, Strain CCMP2098" /LENGTH=132 /DNA_ID=CAMNT_0012632033 /DNA_START=345 /DNA_END=740 /DNA_ORIENTATION=-